MKPLPTPAPAHCVRWLAEHKGAVQVSVAVSLHNYADRIEGTLDALAAQTYAGLELIVVDDASSDGSGQRVQAWMERHRHRFPRSLLVEHQGNGGLAAARNTGFRLARAPWVWVQDADDPIHPAALEQLQRVAVRVSAHVAVVHPLMLILAEEEWPVAYQGEGRPWQREAFRRANTVAATALVRREAWEEVGGYVHIPGGWEDYDFWCQLMDAGWTGVQCPQVLAGYVIHPTSMTRTSTLVRAAQLEQLLQQRHPWLDCMGATSGAGIP